MSEALDSTDLFIRGIWKIIPDDEDVSWVRRSSTAPRSDGPCGDHPTIIKEMLDKGVSANTIARFAKLIGYETAFGICYHLDDPNASYEGFPDEADRIQWALFRVDPESGEPREHIDAGHEHLLMAAPDGREMRPPKTTP